MTELAIGSNANLFRLVNSRDYFNITGVANTVGYYVPDVIPSRDSGEMTVKEREEYRSFHRDLTNEKFTYLLDKKFYNHDTLLMLLDGKALDVEKQRILGLHPNLPEKTKDWVCGGFGFRGPLVFSIAERKDLKLSELNRFLNSGYTAVRVAAVQNPKLPLSTLRKHGQQKFVNANERDTVYAVCAARLPEFKGYPAEWVEEALSAPRTEEKV